MKIVDECLWQQMCADLVLDGDTGKWFREFVETWTTAAEQLMREGTETAGALNSSLPIVEDHLGRAPTHFIGQMLVVIIQHWYCGEELSRQLSPIERRLMEDSLLIKMDELQKQAGQAADEC